MSSSNKINKNNHTSNIHPITKKLLKLRGVNNDEEIESFLNPSYEKDIGDPFSIFDMEKAVNRIIEAIKKQEKICIYSDYDCDGIPGGVLLRTFFEDIGYENVIIYIPHRHNEGYGLHNHAIDVFKKQKVKLIITVDLAITNISEVSYAKEQGIDTIITDHHIPIEKEEGNQEIPNAYAIINSKQNVCNYHDDMLCGCAVAWKLVCALLFILKKESVLYKDKKSDVSLGKEYAKVLDVVSKIKNGYEKWLLDLVAISTIADMVPLIKENRALAYFGLKVLRQTKRHGLNYIFLNQGVSKEHLNEDDIAFTVAPRINAAGRMGDPIQAHNMLYERDSIVAQKYVNDLEGLNQERKKSVKDISSGISFDNDIYKNEVIVTGDLSWEPGVIGLIAQKIIDETGKPTFVWGQGEDKKIIKGSCRSKGDVHVVELMAKCNEIFPEVFISFGGHEQAGGFSCSVSKTEELLSALNETYKYATLKEIDEEKLIPEMSLGLSDVNLNNYNAISVLAPFGVGNPKPLFEFKNIEAFSVKWFGKKEEHLEIIYLNNGENKNDVIKAIMFFADKNIEDKAKKKHTLLAHIEKSVFRGKLDIRLKVVSII